MSIWRIGRISRNVNTPTSIAVSRISTADCQNRYFCVSDVDCCKRDRPVSTCSPVAADSANAACHMGWMASTASRITSGEAGVGDNRAASMRRSEVRMARRCDRVVRIDRDRFDAGQGRQQALAAVAIDLQQPRVVQHLVQLGAALDRRDLLEQLLGVVGGLHAATDQRRAFLRQVSHLGRGNHHAQQQRDGNQRETGQHQAVQGTRARQAHGGGF